MDRIPGRWNSLFGEKHVISGRLRDFTTLLRQKDDRKPLIVRGRACKGTNVRPLGVAPPERWCTFPRVGLASFQVHS
jgi:hypothetical protein